MRRKLSTPVKLIVLLTLMPICGIVAVILVVFLLMGIGLWLEDNYELLSSGSKGIVIVAGTFGVGALVPVLLLWRWLGDE
jgi:hypothetical protein